MTYSNTEGVFRVFITDVSVTFSISRYVCMYSVFSFITSPFKRSNLRAREMTQQLKALASLTENQDSASNTHMAANNSLKTQFQGANALFWPSQTLYTRGVCTHTHTHTEAK